MASFFEESLFFGMAVSLIAYGLGPASEEKAEMGIFKSPASLDHRCDPFSAGTPCRL